MAMANGGELIDPDKYVENVAKLADAFIKLEDEISNTSPTFEQAKRSHGKLIALFANEIDFVIRHFQVFLNDIDNQIESQIVLGEEAEQDEIREISVGENDIFLLKRATSVVSQLVMNHLEKVNSAEALEDLNFGDLLEAFDEFTVRLINVDRDYPDVLSAESAYFKEVLIRVLENPTIPDGVPGLRD